MVPSQDRITFLGRTNFRNEARLFGMRRSDRRAHMYVIGKTGTGKSTLLETMIRQDLAAGEGLALLDPHGDLVEQVVNIVPPHRAGDLIYFDVPSPACELSFNPLRGVPPAKRNLAGSALVEVFKKLWADSWGPRLEHILRNAVLALLDQPEATLADVLRILIDDDYRRDAMINVRNGPVRTFWLKEYAKYTARFRVEAIAPIQNKVGAFITNPALNRILTSGRSEIDLRATIDNRKVLLVNLAKGRIGEDSAALLGSMLASSLGWAAFGRVDIPEESRPDFYLYLDEFQSFTTLSLANMLSELRKYRVSMILAHQYLAQLDPQIQSAILGNVGTLASFRVGFSDAEVLADELYPKFSAADLVALPNFHIYLKVMVNGAPSPPFSAVTLSPES